MDKYNRHYIEQRTRRKTLKDERDGLIISVQKLEDEEIIILESRDIVNTVMIATQKKVISIIEELITGMLQVIYNKSYSAKIKYEVKRNRSEANPVLVKGKSERGLKKESGGGVVDIYSFGMRIALWAVDQKRTDNIFFLDEPFGNVGKKIGRVAEILKQISDKFNIQFIIITHDERLCESIIDKGFLVNYYRGDSIVEEI